MGHYFLHFNSSNDWMIKKKKKIDSSFIQVVSCSAGRNRNSSRGNTDFRIKTTYYCSSRASCGLPCVCVFVLRKATKEGLVETSSNITESLMSISRMMSEQVKQSEDTIGTLGKIKKSFVLLSEKVPSMFPNSSSSLLNIYHLSSSSSSPQPPPPRWCRKPMRSLKTWREPSTWGGNWSSSTTGGSWQTSCSSSWLWPSSSPPSFTSLRSVSSLSFS